MQKTEDVPNNKTLITSTNEISRSEIKEKHHSHTKEHKKHKHEYEHHHKSHHKHHSHKHRDSHSKHRSKHHHHSKSRKSSSSSSSNSYSRSRSQSRDRKTPMRELVKEPIKEKAINEVPFPNSSLPNRDSKSLFESEFPEHESGNIEESKQNQMEIAFEVPKTLEKPLQPPKNEPQLESKQISIEPIKIPEPKPIKSEKIEPEIQTRGRLNSSEEIDKRQAYFRMVEKEREQCENKTENIQEITPPGTEVSEKSIVNSQKGIEKQNILRSPWDDHGYYLKIRTGDIINNYTVTQILGRGVFGSVVKCVDNNIKKECAMKVIRSKEIYEMSGKKELKVLQILNECDLNGIF